MTKLSDVRDYVRSSGLADMPSVVRSETSITITVAHMVSERHCPQTDYIDGEIRNYVSTGQSGDYAVQAYQWLTGATECRPSWTTYPRLYNTDLPLGPLLTAAVELGDWAQENEDTGLVERATAFVRR